jgi:hypothetical protein
VLQVAAHQVPPPPGITGPRAVTEGILPFNAHFRHYQSRASGRNPRRLIPRSRKTAESGNPVRPEFCRSSGAKTRADTACQRSAMANARRRMHGGCQYRTAHRRGLARSRRARWKHGFYSAEALAEQKRVCDLLAQSRELLKHMQAD